MVAKADDSLNSMGRTMIAVDVPTRSALKQKAKAEGLPLSKYLRKIASEGEGSMMDTTIPATKSDIATLRGEINKLAGALMAISASPFYGFDAEKIIPAISQHTQGLEEIERLAYASLGDMIKKLKEKASQLELVGTEKLTTEEFS